MTQSIVMSRERFVVPPDGERLWTSTSGGGPPVVLCHGGPGLWDYLQPVAALLQQQHLVVRFDQRGCGRSTGWDGPFTIAQAVDDLEQLRLALRVERWAVLGHSWGAELALRYAAAHPDRTAAVVCVAVAGDSGRQGYAAERDRRLGVDRPRWQELTGRVRTPLEEQEWCLLQWRPDFSPAEDPQAHAQALWRTRPASARVNQRANRELTADSARHGLLTVAPQVQAPVLLLHGSDDPRPWTATDGLLAALPRAQRIVLDRAGHAPWTERPADVQAVTLQALQPHQPTQERWRPSPIP